MRISFRSLNLTIVMPRIRVRPHYQQMSAFERGRAIGLSEAGWSNRRIARHLGRSDAAIRRCLHEWVNHGRTQRLEGSGRPRQTTDREDRAMVRAALTSPESSLSTIRRVTRTIVSTRTIDRRLRERGLSSRRPLRRLPLTPAHRQARLQWCRVRSTWNLTDWSRIVFSDESRFEVNPDDQRIRVWRRPGERWVPHLTIARHTARQQGVMVWGAISFGSRTPLVVISGTLTARRYVDEILRPVVLPFLSQHPGHAYQQDNARPHTARVSTDYLRSVQTLPWPARSPDLSPIEHVWAVMSRRLRPSENVADLTRQLERVWQEIPQEEIRELYRSMPHRILDCIRARGGPTPY